MITVGDKLAFTDGLFALSQVEVSRVFHSVCWNWKIRSKQQFAIIRKVYSPSGRQPLPMYGQIGVSKRRETHEKLRWCPETGLVFSIHPSPVDDSTSLAIHGAGTRNPRTVSLTYRKTCSPACSHTHCRHTEPQNRVTHVPENLLSGLSFSSKIFIFSCGVFVLCASIISSASLDLTEVEASFITTKITGHHRHHEYCYPLLGITDTTNIAILSWISQTPRILLPSPGHHRHHEYCYPLLDITDTTNIAILSWTSQTP